METDLERMANDKPFGENKDVLTDLKNDKKEVDVEFNCF